MTAERFLNRRLLNRSNGLQSNPFFVNQHTSGPVIFPNHFHSLDAVRGLAALAIVFWHWVHFFREDMAHFQRELQPLYAVFAPLYTKGWRAVDLFFCLSGFIFYWRYSKIVAERIISLRDFFVRRFARLYPLHALTLVAVAVGQYIMMMQAGKYFVYPYNDSYHFVLQAGFAANYGLERGWSFNAPVWSVAYEMALYAVFFGICFVNFRRWWHLILLCGIGCGLTFSSCAPLHQFGACSMSFFMGGLAFYGARFFADLARSAVVLTVLSGLTILAWILAPSEPVQSVLLPAFSGWLGASQLVSLFLKLWYSHSFSLIVFPLTIMLVALCETKWTSVASWTGFLGRISYSSYLLHFPLQLVFAGTAASLGLSYAFFYTPLALGLFFVILLPLSLASYHYFERPCQAAIRKWLISGSGSRRKYSA